jgi:hypothetical protein
VPRAERLAQLGKLQGVYVPSLYETAIDPDTGAQYVATPLRDGLPRRAQRTLVAVQRREHDGLPRFEGDTGRIGELLQRDDVCIELADHGGHALWIVAAVGADASVYVVGRDPNRLRRRH